MKKNLRKLLFMGLIFSVLLGGFAVTKSNTEDPDIWASKHIQLFL